MALTVEEPGPGRPGAGRGSASGPVRLDVGLVNNMPDGALKATEGQFSRRLAAASTGFDVRLRLFALPDIPRSTAAAAHMRGRYADLAALRARPLDALIVTGAEPSAARLADQPGWDGLARLVDWAERHTASTIWSCLAAHAAVLHLDGVARRRLPDKRFGLFECLRVADGGLLDGTPAGLRVPHSRWHEVTEGDLRRSGYRIASRSGEAGVDTFTKSWGSLFVFLQGHPEYDRDTLFREYRRDARRFLAGEVGRRPELPRHCLSPAAAAALEAAALAPGRPRLGSSARELGWELRADLAAIWDASASRLFANWLALVASRL